LGGQFFGTLDPYTRVAALVTDPPSAVKDTFSSKVMTESLRDMYRTQWNLSGTKEALAHGAHLILCNQNDLLRADSSGESVIQVEECLAQVHGEYLNLLWPPRLRNETRSKGHVWGSFGVFFLNVGDVHGGICIQNACWDTLHDFMSTPQLNHITVITSEPLIEDSVDDTIEKVSLTVCHTN
jgi:hypothetical protein